MKICKLIAKAAIKWLLVLLPFGWLLLACWAEAQGGTLCFMAALLALAAVILAANILGAALYALMSEEERRELEL
ncbi:MAG TPA: hypothetical protein H9860_01325 [Candidatus Gemmiger faecavium]|nr:hypothetical protein [Candidatus Gemmiger faecavium]